MMGSGHTHCVAYGMRHPQSSERFSRPVSTPADIICPTTHCPLATSHKIPKLTHRLQYVVRYGRSASGLMSAAYVVVNV